jgi:hypothetical protein
MLQSYVSLPRYHDPGLLKEDRVQHKLNQGLASGYVSLPRYHDPGLLKEDRAQHKLNQALFEEDRRDLSHFTSLQEARNVPQRTRSDRWRDNLPIYDVTPELPSPYASRLPPAGHVECGCSYGIMDRMSKWETVLAVIIIIMATIIVGFVAVSIWGKPDVVSMLTGPTGTR